MADNFDQQYVEAERELERQLTQQHPPSGGYSWWPSRA
jgi:hypothetical protein